jgi:murein L,D-transpeptidase YcbB/YkuD
MRIVVILLAAVVISSCGTDDRPVRDRIRAEVEATAIPPYATRNKDTRQLWKRTRDFYRARALAPVWLHNRRATSKMEALTTAVERADRDGLDPRLYDVAVTSEGGGIGRKRFSDEDAGKIDVRLTFAYLQLASDLADGVSDLARSHPAWHMKPRTFDPAAHLTRAIADGKIAESLDALKPGNHEYRALAELLADYRRRADNGQSAADADGVPLAQRIKQIELNMERWRWIPREPTARHIRVNIPAFRLDVWERDAVALSMRVVVGKKETPTPIFIDSLTHVVLSPYWNVPATIATDETLPSALRDSSFLQRTNMEVLDDKGQVVDPESIDLDRADSLFARATRSFSHGCVRVEQPQALAEYLLKDRPEWTREKIVEAMHGGEERTVTVRDPVPVYIGYWTVDITPGGKAAFLPDVYGLDARQAAALNDSVVQAAQPSRLVSRNR